MAFLYKSKVIIVLEKLGILCLLDHSSSNICCSPCMITCGLFLGLGHTGCPMTATQNMNLRDIPSMLLIWHTPCGRARRIFPVFCVVFCCLSFLCRPWCCCCTFCFTVSILLETHTGENWLQNHLWCPNDPRG